MNTKKAFLSRALLFLAAISFSVAIVSCGFGGLPADFAADLALATNQSSFSEATGTVTLHFADGEVHIALSDIPDAATDCMYMAYATTASGTTTLGMFTLSDAEEHSEAESEGEGEHGHKNGELTAHAHDLDLALYEVSAITVTYECSGETESETVVFSTELTAGESEGEASGGHGGHQH